MTETSTASQNTAPATEAENVSPLSFGKSFWRSKTIWGAIVTMGASLAALAHYQIDATLQSDLIDALTSLATLCGGFIALYGRVRAGHKIG